MTPFSQTRFMKSNPTTNEDGIVLLLVVFVIALASILVVNLAHSTAMGAQVSSNLQRSVSAEYLLKSAVNVARVLIRDDQTLEDSSKDTWGKFADGITIPPDLLSLRDKNVRITLEIRPEESKLPLTALLPQGAQDPNDRWLKAFVALFRSPELNFDQDEEEVDQSGLFEKRHFKAEELAGILVDYMDPGNKSYEAGGIESELPDDVFPNQPIKRTSELSGVPGFTALRIQKLLPYVSAVGSPSTGGPVAAGAAGTQTVNINLAPSIVIRALSPRLDDDMVKRIIEFRKSDDGPFPDNYIGKLTEIIGDQSIVSEIQTMVKTNSKWFQVIAKVDYGTSIMFMRAYLFKNAKDELPEVRSIEIF